jgi:Zn-dependent protease
VVRVPNRRPILDSETLKAILLAIPVLLFSFAAHEYAHAWAALSQGDPTARNAGRLTLNPIKHIDPWMTLILPAMMLIGSHGQSALGGAKPCPVDPRNYRNYRRGDIIVSLAGVTMNLFLALAAAVLFFVIGVIGRDVSGAREGLGFAQEMLSVAVQFNLLLVFFNLMPVPPLDGSHVLKHFLPPSLALAYVKASRYGMLILLALVTIGQPVLYWWLAPSQSLSRMLLRAVAPYFLGTA